MGAWGPAIFSDDTACDIRSDYREMLEDGVDDAEAMQRVITEYQHLADDERHVLWLALAAAQVAVGRLDATVKTEALRIIDEGIGLDLWVEAGPKALASRKAALAKLRNALTSKQKARTKVRKPWVHVTDLVPGDVLAYRRHPDGRYALFRVARMEGGRLGAAPILRQLKWDKASLPPGWRLRSCKPSQRPRQEDRNRVRHSTGGGGQLAMTLALPAVEESNRPSRVITRNISRKATPNVHKTRSPRRNRLRRVGARSGSRKRP